jgi:hypothetical protein
MLIQAPVSTARGTRKHVILACALLLCGANPAYAVSLPTANPQTQPAASLGDKIVAFARAQLGRQVGDGECYDLADLALLHAGAKSAPAYGEITGDADYVWGQPVALRDAQPGDIVQFHNFSLKTTITGTVMSPYGGYGTSQRWETDEREHHTSIVERNLGGTLILLEQNVEPGLVVQRTTLAIASGTVQGSPDGLPADATTTFEVSGDAHVYRPQAAAQMVADR